MTNIVIIGAPGAGKGTLASVIEKYKKIPRISTGDLLRDHVKRGTPIGLKAKSFMDGGKLVPDDVVINIVKERLKEPDVKKSGFMLDGFPRTLDQAIILETITNLDVVAVIDIDKQELKTRILSRLNCPKCGKIFNTASAKLKPLVDGQCDACKVALIRRDDDNEVTFEKRWQTFLDQSTDVVNFYEKTEGLVRHIKSEGLFALTEEELTKVLAVAKLPPRPWHD